MLSDSQWKFLCNEVLSLIEIQETRLLNWGFVNAHINLEQGLEELIQNLPSETLELWHKVLQEHRDSFDVLKNLSDRRLVMKFRDGNYSSRFAQTIRYLFLLRQMMPNQQWQIAPALVSDMRIHLQRRRYPKRNIPVQDVISGLEPIGLTSLQKEVLRTLLQDSHQNPIDLAKFQVEATEEILHSLKINNDQAVVVGAGTGSGKTKAFYLPALAHIVSHPQPNDSIQVLALYPRTELLKDQAAEAYQEGRKLDDLLGSRGQRKISIGIYYGDTPDSAASLLQYRPKAWKETRDQSGLICPYFSCPNAFEGHGEQREMVWSIRDLEQERQDNEHGTFGNYARLRCISCGYEIGAETLLLSRQQMIRRPPDILFTSTEMLNRRMGRANEFSLFGIHTSNPPRLVLLDEIHTYEGIHGAQVAYLIRRWRAARRTNSRAGVCMVGLSATLTQAADFFARFTGVPQYRVRYITPQDDDLVEEGMEYNLVLKGDPASQASLLSTSVQSVMLLARMLDLSYGNDQNISDYAFGSRLFAFADTLDVVNRWAHIEKDAEETKRLARLRKASRNPSAAERQKYEAGQIWPFCEKIGHSLDEPLSIGVVSSQYKGVDPNKAVVLATSALEVGFNDARVGAVLQHKAPHDFASLLQRKGRGGRVRGMRPWMVIVTSDYGRDRWAFQHSEQLFDPLLPPLEMPVENYYVRKIQAVLVLMDWLAWKIQRSFRYIDLWDALSPNRQGNSLLPMRVEIVRCLRELLKVGNVTDEWISYMRNAMQLDDNDMNLLLWGEPRALLLEVIPTIIRKLETNWRKVLDDKVSDHDDGLMLDSPMPEFVPSSLFANLNLMELHVEVPHYKALNSAQTETTVEEIDMILGINEFAPGRVNKRFANVYDEREAHWLALPDEAQLTRGKLPLDYLAPNAEFHRVRTVRFGDQEYTVLRPQKYVLSLIPRDVLATSMAFLDWKVNFLPRSRYELNTSTEQDLENRDVSSQPTMGTKLALSPFSAWKHLIRDITAYNQTNGEWVDIIRFAPRVTVETRREREPRSAPITLDFEWEAGPAGIGYLLEVDSLHFTLEPLDIEALYTRPDWDELYRTLTPEYFRDLLSEDRRISERGLSKFAIEWLYQVERAALSAYAIGAHISLEEAAQSIETHRSAVVDRVLKIIFQSLAVGDEEDGGDQEEKQGRLYEEIRALMAQPEIISALQEHESVLWRQPDEVFWRWLQRCYQSSIGAAIYAAVCRLVPDIQPEDLILDIENEHVWVSETVSGGVGLISRIVDHLGERPRDFELILLDSIRHCDREQLANQLSSIVQLVDHQAVDLNEVFSSIRDSGDLPTVLRSMDALKMVLEKYGIATSRDLIVALNAKLLRPNSNEQLDQLVSRLIRLWDEEEQRLNCVIDLRVISVAALQSQEIASTLNDFLNSMDISTVDENQKFNILQSLLWLDCKTSCPDCIQTRNRFQEFTHPSRRLVLAVIEPYTPCLVFGEPDWSNQATDLLAQQYQATISFGLDEIESGKQRIMELLTVPVEVGFQLLYPHVERIDRKNDRFYITLALRELLGA